MPVGTSNIWEALACPNCHGQTAALAEAPGGALLCARCGARFETVNGVLDLRPASMPTGGEEIDWTEHWSTEKQATLVQRFFSWYRKAVFAAAVAHFVDTYLSSEGVLIEAGCGTAETSIRIGKNGRTLVAVDLIPVVLEHCHPAMDVRICGDIFALPFGDSSVDGIWNVGVMEHFTHDRIDAILMEFRRVLKPGGRVVLLWPAIFSIPQRMLRVLEFFINLRPNKPRFRFHPDEISQLRSVKQGKEVLSRNGFRTVAIDPGLRTLMAFETLVGEKTRSGTEKE